MPRIMKDIAYILAISIIMVHLVPLLLMLTEPVVRNTIFKGTYIEFIITPKLGEENVQKALDKFDSLGYNNVIKYKGIRPIFIREGKLPEHTLGQALSLPGFCEIVLNVELDKKIVEQVVIHEILHCNSIGHSKNYCDIMYKYVNYCNKNSYESSMEKYTKELSKFYDE